MTELSERLKLINDNSVAFLTSMLSTRPQTVRDAHIQKSNIVSGTTGNGFHDMYMSQILSDYNGLGLSQAEQASAFNALAYRMRALGYGAEAIAFAQKSNACDYTNASQVAANTGCIAYAKGLIEGDYAEGLRLYDEVDAYMAANGLFNDTAAIKSDQNKGQIYHRMGLANPLQLTVAVHHYESAIKKIQASDSLNPVQKAQFSGQIGYCYAKTLACMAVQEPENTAYQNKAMDQITKGMEFIASIQNFGFERACFTAVLGQVHAACGDRARAADLLRIACDEQYKHGNTVVPRIVSTSLKLIDVTAPQDADIQRVDLFERLSGFYGPSGHPDLVVYANKYPAAYNAFEKSVAEQQTTSKPKSRPGLRL